MLSSIAITLLQAFRKVGQCLLDKPSKHCKSKEDGLEIILLTPASLEYRRKLTLREKVTCQVTKLVSEGKPMPFSSVFYIGRHSGI